MRQARGWKRGIGSLSVLALIVFLCPVPAWSTDGPTEALELRLQAEQAIAQERRAGHTAMANAMQQALPDLLQEYLATRDGTIALDAVDAAFVQEQFKIARAMEEPGVALALDVFSGPGTGYENELRTGIAGLADFHQTNHFERVSERTLDVQERSMERQMERIERSLEKVENVAERLESKMEAKLQARLDTVAERLEQKQEPKELKTETKTEKAIERAEQKVEKALEKVAEKVEEKVEKVAEKIEQKAEKAAEKAEKKAEKEEKKEGKSEKKE